MVHLDRTREKNRLFRAQDSLLRVKDKFSSNDNRSCFDSSSEFDTSKSMNDTDSVANFDPSSLFDKGCKVPRKITKYANQGN